MINIFNIIFLIFLALTCSSYIIANAYCRKALKYTEEEDQEKSIKYGLLFVLFSKYSDFFMKLSIFVLIVNIILRIFK